jgi:hypothetical protein
MFLNPFILSLLKHLKFSIEIESIIYYFKFKLVKNYGQI